MRVTIIVDASHCPDTKAAGYGFWAVSERGRLAGGGPMANPVQTSASAEAMALVNGFHKALGEGIVRKGDHVLFQTDCTRAIGVMESTIKELNRDERAARKAFYELKREFGCTVSFRHVKGHTNRTEARFVTNNLCDKRAKAGMRLARKRLKGQQS